MKRPAFQFYPDNWRNNSNLRRCSWAARGAWLEVMCLMHDSDRYGALEWTLKEIGQALGCPLSLLRELVDKGVMKGCDKGPSEAFIYVPRSGRKDGDPVELVASQQGPIWYSSRMVRDEYVRNSAGAASRFGAKSDTPPRQSSAPDPSPSRRQGEWQGDPPSRTPSGRRSDGSSTSPPDNTSSLRSSVSAQARATRLPGEFQPSAEAREYALSLGLDPDQLLKAFRDYWLAEGGQRARKLDWNAAYRFWAGREAGQRRGSRAPQRQEGLGETIDRIMRDPLGRGDDGPAPRFDFDGESEEVLNG